MRKWFYLGLMYSVLAVVDLGRPPDNSVRCFQARTDRHVEQSLVSPCVADQIADGRVPWAIERLNFPEGGTLLISDPLGGRSLHRLFGCLDPYVAFTLLVLFQFTFSGLVMHGFAEALR